MALRLAETRDSGPNVSVMAGLGGTPLTAQPPSPPLRLRSGQAYPTEGEGEETLAICIYFSDSDVISSTVKSYEGNYC